MTASAGTFLRTFRRLRPWLAIVLLAASGAGAGEIAEISPDELRSRAGKPDAPLVLDVRSAEEFAAGRVPGAKHIPYDEVPARLAELGPPREVVVYCERGGRAMKAAEALAGAGFAVGHLTGHMKGWREAGLPLEQ